MSFQKIIVIVVLAALVGMVVPTWYFIFYRSAGQKENNNPNQSFIGSRVYKNLSGQGLSKFPMEVLKDKSLEELDLSDNRLTGAFPAEIRQLVNLKVLRAGNNLLTGIPAEIGQLSNLEILDFSYNQLTGLPREIANLKKLKTLNLRGNMPSSQDLEYIRQALPGLTILL